ncbi:hypothetical protein LLE49_21535 [Alicyclobacillus tolerans]|uniref:YcdB/YcdC domain-containing protein n=1 Tax=Alicyclobacillus tolerans TaxID=90970 RepID=UPI001F31DD87|nr:YcdB/YcdC domain-containing protein [Alicyclobacillus tolerans]MCF8567308.1 hypothetical protein [Alicyclobacillus tolerans]
MGQLGRRMALGSMGVIAILGTGATTALAASSASSVTTSTTSSTTLVPKTVTNIGGTSSSEKAKLSSSDALNIARKLFPKVFQGNGTPNVSLQTDPYGKQTYQLNGSPMAFNQQVGPHLNQNFTYISIDANSGQVLHYQHNLSNWRTSNTSISAATAKADAESWLKKLAPNQYSELILQPGSDTSTHSFAFEFVRKVNGIIATFDNATVQLSPSGDLVNYNFSWPNATFPAVPESILSQTDAGAAFKKDLQLQLRYQAQPSPTGLGPETLVYVPQPMNPGTILPTMTPRIDAVSGQLLGMSGKPLSPLTTAQPLTPIDPSGPTNLPKTAMTPLSNADIENLVMKELNLTPPDWTVANSQDATGGNSVVSGHKEYSIGFSNPKTGDNVNVQVDATDGVIVNYNDGTITTGSSSGKALTDTALQAKADAFVKQIFPSLTGAITHGTKMQKNIGPSQQASFQYDFLVNGIPVTGFNVTLDAFTGKVMFYNLIQDPSGTFPSTTGVMSLADAKTTYIQKDPVELQYVLPQSENTIPGQGFHITYGDKAQLVYAAAPIANGTGTLNATTGKWIQYPMFGFGGSTVNVPGNATAAQKAISLLEQNGVVTADEAKANLSSPITRAEFVAWLSRAYNMNISGSPAPQFPDVQPDNPYATEISTALMQGWLPNVGDLKPSDALTRMQAATWMVDWLGWAEPASHNNFFRLPYSDVSAISKPNQGAAAMMSDTGVIPLENGKFNPNSTMTVGDAATALVNAIEMYVSDQNAIN